MVVFNKKKKTGPTVTLNCYRELVRDNWHLAGILTARSPENSSLHVCILYDILHVLVLILDVSAVCELPADPFSLLP